MAVLQKPRRRIRGSAGVGWRYSRASHGGWDPTRAASPPTL